MKNGRGNIKEMYRALASRGGKECLRRRGKEFFSQIANKRWKSQYLESGDQGGPRGVTQESAVKMSRLEKIRAVIRRHQNALADRYGVQVVGLFGSFAEGRQRSGSDVDLLVEMVRPISLLELVGAELYLTKVLGVKADLVPRRAVRAELRDVVSRQAVAV